MVEIHVVHAESGTGVPLPTAQEKRERLIGHYQGVTLDLGTGEFYADEHDWRLDPSVTGAGAPPFLPGNPTGPRVRWTLDSGIDDDRSHIPPANFPYQTRAQLNALLDELRPAVDVFAQHMLPVPGRDGLYDYTRLSVAAGLAIRSRLQRTQHPLPETIEPTSEWDRDFAEVAEHDAVLAELLENTLPGGGRDLDALSDQNIEQVASLCRTGFAYEHAPGVLAALGLDATQRPHGGLRLFGATAWLCGLRQRLAEGRQVVDAARWFATHPVPNELVDLPGREIARWAPRYNASLAGHGVAVVGLRNWARDHQPQLREQARGELDRLGEEARLAEQAARGARQRRNAAISRILSWDEGADTDSALGRRGGVSHTTVAKLRAAADDDRQDEAEAAAI